MKDATTRQWSRKGPLTLLVSPASATYGRGWEIGDDYTISLNGNHSDMVKFSEYDRDGYEKVCDVLKGFVRRANPVIKTRMEIFLNSTIIQREGAQDVRSHFLKMLTMTKVHQANTQDPS